MDYTPNRLSEMYIVVWIVLDVFPCDSMLLKYFIGTLQDKALQDGNGPQ